MQQLKAQKKAFEESLDDFAKEVLSGEDFPNLKEKHGDGYEKKLSKFASIDVQNLENAMGLMRELHDIWKIMAIIVGERSFGTISRSPRPFLADSEESNDLNLIKQTDKSYLINKRIKCRHCRACHQNRAIFIIYNLRKVDNIFYPIFFLLKMIIVFCPEHHSYFLILMTYF